MSRWKLIAQSLRHYWRTHLGVALGAAVASAVLVGALAVGDSVRGSLRRHVQERIGKIDVVLGAGDRLFRSELAAELADGLAGEGLRTAPLLVLDGVAARPDGARRAREVRLDGIDARFHDFGLRPWRGPHPGPDQALLNERLAAQLDVAAGDTVIVRIEQPSAVPRDMVLATVDDATLALRLEVVGILPDVALGVFDLSATQVPPFAAFVDLGWLQDELGVDGGANLMLARAEGRGLSALEQLPPLLRERWTLDDGQLEVRALAPNRLEVRSPRVFLDPAVEEAFTQPDATRVLTYFVNELRVGERATPYSMVAAVDGPAADLVPVPADLASGEIALGQWLADDLAAAVGDELELRYYVLGPARRLVEETSTFRVRAIVPLEGLAGDRELMPDFPGLSDAESCRDWETGVPIDLDRVRDRDEEYWDERGGTPKAFVSLEDGRRMWGNRFGGLTAVRVPGADPAALAAELRGRLDPTELGLVVRDVRGAALAGAAPATDFGGLFLGLSFFLIVAAVLLTGMLFVFGVESRASELGLLLAVGFPPKVVRAVFLLEGIALAAAGGLLGIPAGLLYTRAVLAGLSSVWSGAVAGTAIDYHVSATSVAGGAVIALLASVVAMAFALRGQLRRPVVELLAGAPPATARRTGRARVAVAVTAVAGLGALAVVFTAGASGAAAAGAFFGAGALLLVAGLAASRALISRWAVPSVGAFTLGRLGLSNGARRPGRSMATVALLACGSFLVLSVGANRLDVGDPGARASGTGGFALFARSGLPVLQDLASVEGQDTYGLEPEDLAGVELVPMRLRQGDDASCLNLGVPREPRLVGVVPAQLAERGAFSFARTIAPTDDPWLLLDQEPPGSDVVPAIADQASVQWTMHKQLGDLLDYTDERGQPFQVRIVATLAGSILQGDLLIAARHFEERYPSESGYRRFLVDASPERAPEVAARLSAALADVGLEVTPAADRLREFNAVQNTYLLVFQLLGGLGMLLGTAGLGMVVLRNALERRAELAVLRAVGYPARAVRRLLFGEHALLLALGLGVGALAAALALAPTAGAGRASVGAPAVLLLALGLSGAAWVALATRLSLRQRPLDALRSE